MDQVTRRRRRDASMPSPAADVPTDSPFLFAMTFTNLNVVDYTLADNARPFTAVSRGRSFALFGLTFDHL